MNTLAKRIAEDLGLAYHKKLRYAGGFYRDFLVTIHEDLASPVVMVNIYLATESGKAARERLLDFCKEQTKNLRNFVEYSLVYAEGEEGDENRLAGRLTLAVFMERGQAEQTVTDVRQCLAAVADALLENGFFTVCIACGTRNGVGLYAVDGEWMPECGECLAEYKQHTRKIFTDAALSGWKWFAGMCGAILYAAPGAALWTALNAQGTPVSGGLFGGGLMAYMTFAGFKKFTRGEYTLRSMYACAGLVLFLCFFATLAGWVAGIQMEMKGSVRDALAVLLAGGLSPAWVGAGVTSLLIGLAALHFAMTWHVYPLRKVYRQGLPVVEIVAPDAGSDAP